MSIYHTDKNISLISILSRDMVSCKRFVASVKCYIHILSYTPILPLMKDSKGNPSGFPCMRDTRDIFYISRDILYVTFLDGFS